MLQAGSWHDARVFLITGSADCSVRIWLLGRGLIKGASALRQWAGCPLPPHPRRVLNGHGNVVKCLAASASLDVVVSGDADGVCLIHSIRKGRMLRAFFHPDGLAILLLQISPVGDIFFCGEGARGVFMTDLHGLVIRHVDPTSSRAPLQTRASLASRRLPAVDTGISGGAAISCITLSDDGTLLLAGDAEGRVLVIDARTLILLRVFPRTCAGSVGEEGCGAVLSMALSPCSNYLVVGTAGGELQVYSSLPQTSTPPHDSPPGAASPVSP
jgi:WD40 repeat protein